MKFVIPHVAFDDEGTGRNRITVKVFFIKGFRFA